MRIVEMARNDIKNSSLLKTKFLIYAFNGRTQIFRRIFLQKVSFFLFCNAKELILGIFCRLNN
ncbi:hypothetical protein HMPREF2955_13450 [Prevotella sp. HMSC073D09]|nr:hypothetical protein HMPREF2955_13450 [Prevotella sp. HMSC073D09]